MCVKDVGQDVHHKTMKYNLQKRNPTLAVKYRIILEIETLQVHIGMRVFFRELCCD